MYSILLIRKADIKKKQKGMLKYIYYYLFFLQIGKMISNVTLGIEQDKEWKNNRKAIIFKIKLSWEMNGWNSLLTAQWNVKYTGLSKLQREVMKAWKKKNKRGCWIESTDLL